MSKQPIENSKRFLDAYYISLFSLFMVSIISFITRFDIPNIEAKRVFTITPMGLSTLPISWLFDVPSSCTPIGNFSHFYGYFVMFLTTWLLELPFYFFFKTSLIRKINMSFLTNLSTHPFVFFVFPCIGWSYGTTLFVSELFAFMLEIMLVIYFTKEYRKSIILVTLANLLSWQIGVYIYTLV